MTSSSAPSCDVSEAARFYYAQMCDARKLFQLLTSQLKGRESESRDPNRNYRIYKGHFPPIRLQKLPAKKRFFSD